MVNQISKSLGIVDFLKVYRVSKSLGIVDNADQL